MYYRLLHALRYGRGDEGFRAGVSAARMDLQDVLIALRGEAVAETGWTDQQTQDFCESMVAKQRTAFGAADPIFKDVFDRLVENETKDLANYGG